MQDKYKQIIRLGLIVAIVYLGFRFLLPLFFPFLLAYVIAVLLRKPVRFLKKKFRLRPAFGGGLLLILILVVLGGGIVYAVKLLLKQFAAFAANYMFYAKEWNGYLEQFCSYCDSMLRIQRGSTFSLLTNSLDGIVLFFQQELIPFLTKNSLKAAVSVTELMAAVLLTFVAVLLYLKDLTEEKQEEEVPGKVKVEQEKPMLDFLAAEWREIRKELSGAGVAYVKTQVILIFLVSITCSLGLFLIKNPYALLFGVAIGVFDAFPVLGSGLILIPWSVVCFIQGKMFSGAVLLTLFGICQFFREYLEPKLLGGKIGVRPVHSLMAIYVGYELFGISGLFLGPVGLVLIKSIWRVSEP